MQQRISLSPTGLEVLLALSQSPQGARMKSIAASLDVSTTQVEAALRAMVGLGIVARMATGHRYTLRNDHPALPELVTLAARMSAPARAIDIVLRSNDTIRFAWRDTEGYIVVVAAEDPVDPRDSSELLEMVVPQIRLGRPDVPAIERFEAHEFARLMKVAPSLRMRIASAAQVKGAAQFATPKPAARKPPRRDHALGAP